MQILVATLRGAVHQQQRAAAYAALLPSLLLIHKCTCARALMMCTLVVRVLFRVSEWYQKYLLSAGASPVVPERGGRGAAAPPAFLPGGASGAVLPFAFQYDSNEANACSSQSSLIQSRIINRL